MRSPTPLAPPTNTPAPGTLTRRGKIVLGVILVLILIPALLSIRAFVSNLSKGSAPIPISPSPTQIPQIKGDFTVETKDNPKEKKLTDVYLKDKKSEKEMLFMTLPDVYKQHYHNAEFHNGNLYIVKRTGGDDGYQNNPNWTDMLWRYNSAKQGKQLYAVRGLDFRVSDDEKYITISTNDGVKILDTQGKVLKSFQTNQLQTLPQFQPSLSVLGIADNTIWVANHLGPELSGLARITLPSFTITKYDLSNLGIGSEFSLNMEKSIIAFSDYPAFLDIDSQQEYIKSGKKVKLTIYGLDKKTSQVLMTSITKPFNPVWKDANTLEYNDTTTTGDKRLEYKLP